MLEPCKAWNVKQPHPSHRSLEDADLAGVSHIPPALGGGCWQISKTVSASMLN